MERKMKLTTKYSLLSWLCSVWLFMQMTAVAFTRSMREVHIHHNVHWDPLLQSVEDVVLQVCPDTRDCADVVYFFYEQGLRSRLDDFYEDYRMRFEGGFAQHYAWLDTTDGATQQDVIDTLLEAHHLMNGLLQPRSYCNHVKASNSRDKKRCHFFQIAASMGLLGRQLTADNLAVDAPLNLDAFSALIEDFCNEMYYEHAEALAVFVLYRFIHSHYKTPLYARYQVDFEKAIFRISVVLSEIQKLRGHLEHSTTFVLAFLNSARILQSNPFSEFGASLLPLYKLRSLLSIPSMPSPTNVSIYYRAEMIADLDRFYETLQRDAVRISVSQLLSTVSATSFYMAHQGLDDSDIQTRLYNIYSTICPELNFMAPHLTQSSSNPRQSTVIRIGFLSVHFHDHSIGRILIEVMSMMKDLVLQIGEKGYSVEIFAYSIHRPIVEDSLIHEDLVMDIRSDSITEAFSNRFGDHFIHLPMNIQFCRDAIARDELDILIYGDIGMDLMSYLLAYSRLATYQIAFWGHPITTALPSIDYYFGLDDEVPYANHFYSEQLVRFDYINTVPLPLDKFNNTKNTSILFSLGIPSNAKVAIVFGRLFKFHPEFIETLVDIAYELKSTNCYIVVFVENVLEFNGIVWDQVIDSIARKSGRNNEQFFSIKNHVKLASYQLYYQVAEAAHIALDTFPYGGCITAHDSFYHGLPIVTYPSEHVRGRYTLSLYKQMQNMELVCFDRPCYVSKVLELMHDDEYYKEIRSRVRVDFATKMRKNDKVAMDWIRFLVPLVVS